MPIIGLLSDTHGFVHPKVYDFFANCDEIWHAGDIGDAETALELSVFKPLRAVHGNIDGFDVRGDYPRYQSFTSGEVKVIMTHIGGYPGRYEPEARKIIELEKPGLFISGHFHILKVMYDPKYQLLHINPGAAGRSGMHRVITFVRFIIEGNNIRDLEVFEARRSAEKY